MSVPGPAVQPAWRRRLLVLGPALLLAVLAALGVGRAAADRLEPTRPGVTARQGETVRVAGVDYRLDKLTVAASFPAEEATDAAVRGPDGSVIVLAEIIQTITDRSVSLDDHTCDVSLHGADAVWMTDSDYTSPMRRPEAVVCGSLSDLPLRYDEPRRIGVTFVVPDAVARDQLSVWISVRGGAEVVAFSR